jgi:hypothetical protein
MEIGPNLASLIENLAGDALVALLLFGIGYILVRLIEDV